MRKSILVTGAGGFIGSHLARSLMDDGHIVIGVDIVSNSYWRLHEIADHFYKIDLRNQQGKLAKLFDKHAFDQVYHLAADMGGVGYIGAHNDAQIISNNTRVDINVAEATFKHGCKDLVFTSSACRYPDPLAINKDPLYKLKEEDAHPAHPCDGYGWSKLSTEFLLDGYNRNHGTRYKVAVLNNIYGDPGTYKGGKEKSPAAICRKVAEATDTVQIWGDGTAWRSYCHVSDAVSGLKVIMANNVLSPVNIANDNAITIQRLTELVIGLSGKDLKIKHIAGPVGANSRLSDVTKAKLRLGWEAKTDLVEGMKSLYTWINSQVNP